VTREELRTQLWPGDTFVDFNHGLNAAVNKLRDALCDSADDPKYIETLPRRGYRFIATVERAMQEPVAKIVTASSARSPEPQAQIVAAGEPTVPPANGTLPTLDVPSLERIASQPNKRRGWLRRVVPVAAVLVGLWVLVNVGILDIMRSYSARQEKRAKEAAVSRKLDGLTPLTNLPDPTSDPAFSPDGRQVAFRRGGNAPESAGIFVKPIGSSQLRQLTNRPEDCCPVWSPDGSLIAFSRFSGKEHLIYTVPAGGGALRKLYSTAAGPKRGELDWSPDGESIVFVGESGQGTSSIFVLSLKDLTAHRITAPPPLNKDWGPAFSPDGQTLAFVRTHETGLPETIVVMPAAGGESRVVVTYHNGILGPPAWTADGQSIVFASGTDPGLSRVPAFGEENTTAVPVAGTPAWHPAISRQGQRLAFQTSSKAVSVWQSDLTTHAKLDSRRVVVTDTGRNEGAQVSPDGSKLVFMSNRSGSMEIWVSERDGSNAIRLTDMGGVGTPHWSPDGRTIVFDVDSREQRGIFAVDVAGGFPRPLVQDSSSNLVPNWSRDGRWVYFASNRTGIWQVWKVPSTGGPAIQVTTHGGFVAYESSDGDVLYYSKFNMPNPEVWRVPVEGGVEALLSPLLRPETWASWAPVDGGIYFVQAGMNGEAVVMFLDTANGLVERKGLLAGMPFWLSATPDGKSVLYEHLDQEETHIMLVENFR
jgi:Tol biopolymer transport system component